MLLLTIDFPVDEVVDMDVGIDDDDVGRFQLGRVSLLMIRVHVDDGTGTSELAWRG